MSIVQPFSVIAHITSADHGQVLAANAVAIIAVIAILLVMVLLVVLGGRRKGKPGADATTAAKVDETLDATASRARIPASKEVFSDAPAPVKEPSRVAEKTADKKAEKAAEKAERAAEKELEEDDEAEVDAAWELADDDEVGAAASAKTRAEADAAAKSETEARARADDKAREADAKKRDAEARAVDAEAKKREADEAAKRAEGGQDEAAKAAAVKAAEAAKAAADELKRAEQEARAEAARAAEARDKAVKEAAERAKAEAKAEAEAEAKAKSEARRKEQEAKAKVEADAKAKVEAGAKALTEDEKKRAAEAKKRGGDEDEGPAKTLKDGLGRTRKEGFIAKLSSLFAGKQIDQDLLDEVEEALFTADIGVRTAERLLGAVREALSKKELKDANKVWEVLRGEAQKILEGANAGGKVGTPKPGEPFVTMVLGVNGTGKTTSIGKMAHKLIAEQHTVTLVAGDTFRAAATEQLEHWARRVGAPCIKGKEGADPASVVFDGVKQALEAKTEFVLVDTAGRLHNNTNLMEELKKVRRVMGRAIEGAPHEVLMVLDATTGQNGITQAKLFKDATDVTGIILTKLDGTAKGGVVLGVCDELKIPIKWIGVGERVADLRVFDSKEFVDELFTPPA